MSTDKKESKAKDIWQIIQTQQAPNAQEQQDNNILIVGNKGSGKTTLINKFIRKEESGNPKSTTALEYTHAKREEAKVVKVAHLWELGGGEQLNSLMDVVITPENIHTVMVVVVADLSDPHSVWASVYYWLNRIKKRVGECFLKMQQRGSGTPGKMIQRMQKRFGENHPDAGKVTFIGIPILIVASKHDSFRDEGSEYAKVMAKTLRFFAHSYAASLVYTSHKDERDMTKYRALLNHLVFGSPLSGEKLLQVDHGSSLFVWTGKDTFDKIGPPQGASKPPGFISCGNEEHDRWKAPFETVFTAKEGGLDGSGKDGFDPHDPEYAEPLVDSMRSVKDDELEQYRQSRADRKSVV